MYEKEHATEWAKNLGKYYQETINRIRPQPPMEHRPCSQPPAELVLLLGNFCQDQDQVLSYNCVLLIM